VINRGDSVVKQLQQHRRKDEQAVGTVVEKSNDTPSFLECWPIVLRHELPSVEEDENVRPLVIDIPNCLLRQTFDCEVATSSNLEPVGRVYLRSGVQLM